MRRTAENAGMLGLTLGRARVACSALPLARTVSSKVAAGGPAGGGLLPPRQPAPPPTSPQSPETPVEQYNSPDALAQLPHFTTASNRFLFFWMFGFLKPVKWIVFAACFYVALAVAVEVLVVNWIKIVVNHIQNLQPGSGAGIGFWTWFWRDT